MIIHLFAGELSGSRSMVLRLFLIFFLCISVQGYLWAEDPPAENPEPAETDYISRIQFLEDSLAQNPQNTTIERDLAQAYLKYSAHLIEQKRLKEASDYLQMAKNLGADPDSIKQLEPGLQSVIEETKAGTGKTDQSPGNALPEFSLPSSENPESYFMGKAIVYEIFEEGVAAYKARDYDLAEQQMKQVLKYEPSNKYAYELLGDIYYQSQNLNAAKSHWEKSITSDNMKRVQQKLDKVLKELPVERGLKAEDEEHFIIRYDREQKDYSPYEIKTFLREAYRAVYRDLGVPISGRVTVILYDQEVFNKKVKAKHWSGALFDGKIRIPMEKNIENDPSKIRQLKRLIRHELAHVFVYEAGGKNVPLWLHEGIAQYEEAKTSPIYIGDFLNSFRRGKTYNLKQLERGEKLLKDQTSVLLFYQQSYLFVSYIIKKYSFFKLKGLLKEIAKGENLDSAILLVFNREPEELDKDFQSWAKANL